MSEEKDAIEQVVTELRAQGARVVSLSSEADAAWEYLAHQSWRCKHYDLCRCGLDAMTDAKGWPRVERTSVVEGG